MSAAPAPRVAYMVRVHLGVLACNLTHRAREHDRPRIYEASDAADWLVQTGDEGDIVFRRTSDPSVFYSDEEPRKYLDPDEAADVWSCRGVAPNFLGPVPITEQDWRQRRLEANRATMRKRRRANKRA